jgi:CheY-like chemotaxis protein
VTTANGEEVPTVQQPGTVLVVDDEPDVLLLCRVNLELEGYTVLEAPDGEIGLALARAEHPDVILLDVQMPGIDGWQVLAALKADPEVRAIPVVMLTARVQGPEQRRGLTEGVTEYLTKPVSPVTLMHAVHDVLATDPAEEERRRRLLLEKLQLLLDD